jgi:hypothetical protein
MGQTTGMGLFLPVKYLYTGSYYNIQTAKWYNMDSYSESNEIKICSNVPWTVQYKMFDSSKMEIQDYR